MPDIVGAPRLQRKQMVLAQRKPQLDEGRGTNENMHANKRAEWPRPRPYRGQSAHSGNPTLSTRRDVPKALIRKWALRHSLERCVGLDLQDWIRNISTSRGRSGTSVLRKVRHT